MTLKESSQFLNDAAHQIYDHVDAGAVVTLALVKDGDGPLTLAVGSTGLPHATCIIADVMPSVADALKAAANSKEPVRKAFLARVRDADAN